MADTTAISIRMTVEEQEYLEHMRQALEAHLRQVPHGQGIHVTQRYVVLEGLHLLETALQQQEKEVTSHE